MRISFLPSKKGGRSFGEKMQQGSPLPRGSLFEGAINTPTTHHARTKSRESVNLARQAYAAPTWRELVELTSGHHDGVSSCTLLSAFYLNSVSQTEEDVRVRKAILSAHVSPLLLSGDSPFALVEPRTQHVVGRNSTYWATSRHPLLWHGRAFAEIGTATATSTRDYIAAANSCLTLYSQAERVEREGIALQEDASFRQICLRFQRGEAAIRSALYPCVILCVSEAERRLRLIALERDAFLRIPFVVGAEALKSSALCDAEKAQTEKEEMLVRVHALDALGSYPSSDEKEGGRSMT